MTLAEFLLWHRKNVGLSIRKAAFKIGISFPYLADLENGRKRHPKMEMISKIAAFYGINEDHLCIISERIPQDCFWKVIRRPELLKVIRDYPE